MDVTFEVLDQVAVPISKANPTFDKTAEAAREIIVNLNETQDEDYDGVALVYNRADAGNLASGGGWATVNDVF